VLLVAVGAGYTAGRGLARWAYEILIRDCAAKKRLTLDTAYLGGAGHIPIQVLVYKNRDIARAGQHLCVWPQLAIVGISLPRFSITE